MTSYWGGLMSNWGLNIKNGKRLNKCRNEIKKIDEFNIAKKDIIKNNGTILAFEKEAIPFVQVVLPLSTFQYKLSWEKITTRVAFHTTRHWEACGGVLLVLRNFPA